MTRSPRLAHSTAVSASKTARPTAAPGEAFRPLTILVALARALGSNVARRSWSTCAGSIRPTASLRGDDPLLDHVDRDLHRGRGGPLGRAGLEHVELAALDRELEVLDVAVVLLELLADPLELGVDRRHVGLHLADLGRRPDAGHDVLALGVGQVLAEEDLLAGVRVAGERDAGARVVAHVAEDHGHDVDRGAQVVGDLLVVAVVDRALAEPAGEDGLDRQVELLVRVAREVAPGVLADDPLGLLDDLAQGGGVEVGVLLGAVALLGGVEGVVEALALHVHDDPAEHLDEPAVGVPAEALVAGQRDQALERLLVEPEVEDRVHHPGHGELGARADRDEERVGGSPKPLPVSASTSLTASRTSSQRPSGSFSPAVK